MARLEGIQLGAYEIIERIGSGGMAEVYRAKQRTAFDREVAIKVIRKGYAEDEDFRARFLREARAISQLSHLNILPLIEFGESKVNEDEILFLVMPYIAGGTLRDRIKKQGGPLPLRDTIRIFNQLCEAIEHAHQHGLVHRDIKPSNVLLQDGRNVLLADFGIALDTGDARLTSTGMGLGTAEYMAPEQAKGQADKRSDVYSLGVVLYVMLTGQAPYAGSTPFDVLLKHATEPLPSISELNPEVPEPIAQVVQTALAKSPDDRFQSAQAMLNAFEGAVIQIGPQAIASLQWSGSIPAVRLPGGISRPGVSDPSGQGASGGSAAPISGPSAGAPGSGPYSGPSAPISGPSDGAGLEDQPTIRKEPAFVPAGASAATASAQVEPPTIISAEPATTISATAKTSLAPNLALAQSGPVPAAQPEARPGEHPSSPIAPVPPGKPRNKALIAGLIVLVVVMVGGAALAAGLLLRSQPTPGTTTTQPTATATATPGPLTFIPGTACSQAATNPIAPAKQPIRYLPPVVNDQGQGSPAFVAVHYDGSLYYTDQAIQGIYSLSPALSQHNNSLRHSTTGKPSGIVITPDASSRVYYLQQVADASGKPVEQLKLAGNASAVLATIPVPTSTTGLPGFGLALNPTNKALLVPNGSTGILSCFSQSTQQLSPVVTGLKQPVAAIVDSAGNIYVADQGANQIMRFPAKGSKADWTQSFAGPVDLALDQSGYLLATLQGAGLGDGQVVRINPTTGKLVDTLMKNLQQPRGITLDTSQYHSGTVYFVDQGTNSIYAMCTTRNSICR